LFGPLQRGIVDDIAVFGNLHPDLEPDRAACEALRNFFNR
jgi:hypothetical protein